MAKSKGELVRFAVQLQLIEGPETFTTIAQFDHDPTAEFGHDVFDEGLHIDLYSRSERDVKIYPRHPPLDNFDAGAVVRRCTDYFTEHAGWFLDAYRGAISPDEPPSW